MIVTFVRYPPRRTHRYFMLWAKQVAKGKITEEEFQVKINTL
jgi:uncharacterized membrane protein